MCPLAETSSNVIVMSTLGVVLSTLVFWLSVYFAVHFQNSTIDQVSKMDWPERFAMELLSSSAAAISIMFFLGCVDLMIKAWI